MSDSCAFERFSLVRNSRCFFLMAQDNVFNKGNKYFISRTNGRLFVSFHGNYNT